MPASWLSIMLSFNLDTAVGFLCCVTRVNVTVANAIKNAPSKVLYKMALGSATYFCPIVTNKNTIMSIGRICLVLYITF